MIESLNLDPQAADVGYWFVWFFLHQNPMTSYIEPTSGSVEMFELMF